ncbi:MAG: 8-oxoguanine deaminase [Pseudomonadota bacterium]
MPLWIQSPLAILAEGAEGGLVVEGSRIVELVPAGARPETPYDAVFDASSHVVIPGLVNTHHHVFQTLTRAFPPSANKPLFPWLQANYPVWAHITPDMFRLATRLAFTELLMSGCTCASDHHYLFPEGLEDAVDVQVEEADRLGLRVTVTRGSMNLSEKDGGLPPDSVVQDEDAILLDCERVLGRYHDTRPGAMTQIALAPCAPFTVSKRLMRESARLAEAHDCRLHTHLGETHDEDAYCLEQFGMRPVDYLEEQGWLNDRVWLAHGIHFQDAEVERLGKHGVGVCHCPTSNMTLASGQCRTLELEAAGAPVGLGVDGSASNDNSNLMEGVRHAMMINRLTYGAEAVTCRTALRWGTQGSAACLGRSDIGRIAVGCEADLAFYSLDELRFSGAHDPIDALVICGAHKADRVMVAGRWRIEGGLPVGQDIARLRHEHHAAAMRLAELAGV